MVDTDQALATPAVEALQLRRAPAPREAADLAKFETWSFEGRDTFSPAAGGLQVHLVEVLVTGCLSEIKGVAADSVDNSHPR